jgi:aryl-alcohol dehydrogenase-like predicted oxidoreductase
MTKSLPDVPVVGLGCMNLSHAYGHSPPREQAERILLAALDIGYRHFDTAALYGFGKNEELLGSVLSKRRDDFFLASKGGIGKADGVRVIDGRPESLLKACEESLRLLQTEVLDLYYLHRWDKEVPIEDSMGAMKQLLDEGKIRAIGLSEVSAATLRKAHADRRGAVGVFAVESKRRSRCPRRLRRDGYYVCRVFTACARFSY